MIDDRNQVNRIMEGRSHEGRRGGGEESCKVVDWDEIICATCGEQTAQQHNTNIEHHRLGSQQSTELTGLGTHFISQGSLPISGGRP